MSEEKKEIVFGGPSLDPDSKAAYRDRIERARMGGVNSLKSAEPVGFVERPNMPMLRREPVQVPPAQPDHSQGVKPRPAGSPPVSSFTQQQLEAVAKYNEDLRKQEETKEESKEEKKGVSEEDLFSLIDFNSKSEAERILDNKARRATIEGRLQPMSLARMIERDEEQQLVPIVPGQFEVLYRSMTPRESLFIKDLIFREQNKSDLYLQEKYSLFQLTCCVVEINGKRFPEHRDQNGVPDETKFKEKLALLLSKSGYVIADLLVNYGWFDIRVRKLFNPDDLKNG